ncbi:MAG: sulfur oxidation c-type cytochrome SoxA [Gammaproteobacteria bacterium]|jgi:sulfur-oxidizing protein SoxA|nr:sulfur oxidation c-type cytochrome SoxA [Gammaproteobacteria bacterium]
MKKLLIASILLGLLGGLAVTAQATPQEDLAELRAYFKNRFPNTPFKDYINGVYSIDPASREEWEEIEEFPPYELSISNGKELFDTPFANGKSYADCFVNGGIGIAERYPFFDSNSGQVITLESAINACREANGEEPLKWQKGPIADISAYMHYTSRGNIINIQVPSDNPAALAAYERGKNHFYAKRGQLNMSCADCHVYNSGNKIRADILSPEIGHTTHFPVYRSSWGELGTLHRRYDGCNKQVRAKPYPSQGEEYRALEYFDTYMSNGLEINGPGARK